MKKTILICLMVILFSGLVLATGPGLPHAFYGVVKYSNGTIVKEGMVVAKINNQQAGTSDIINGVYDLVVESNTEGGKIYFYINNKEVEDYVFKGFEITELDLVVEEVADDTDDSNGEDDSGGSSGGSGDSSNSDSSSGSSSLTSASLVLNPVEKDDADVDEQGVETLNGDSASSGITGAVTGGAFEGGLVVAVGLVVLILVVLAVVVVVRRR